MSPPRLVEDTAVQCDKTGKGGQIRVGILSS